MNSFNVFFALFLLGILFSGCEKDPYADAKENHTFFRCKVNGKEWHNEGYGFYGDRSAMEYYVAPEWHEESGKFVIKMKYQPNENTLESLGLYVEKELKIGENITPYYQFDIYKPNIKFYSADTTYNNYLEIESIDSINKIIVGKFEFRAITEDGQDTVLVTDGEFDWKPYWYIY